MKILVDDREKDDVFDELRALKLDYQKTRLPVGDFVLNDVVIEHKRTQDFVCSIIDGRLTDQCYQMTQTYKRAFVIVSGEWGEYGLHQHCVLGKIASIVVKWGVPVLFAKDVHEMCYLVMKIFEKLDSGEQFELPNRIHVSPKARRVSVLTAIEGIGYDKAEKIYNHFGSLKGLFFAKADDFKKVDGVGERTAKKIWSFLHEDDGVGQFITREQLTDCGIVEVTDS